MRKAGNIPAALYGRKVKAANIQVHGKTFSKLLESSASDNILVSLKIAGILGRPARPRAGSAARLPQAAASSMSISTRWL
jgi:ribosomal protein L25 (general stress protein Ctc)